MYVSRKHPIIRTVREHRHADGYAPNAVEVAKWVKIFNREIFDNKLHKFDFIYVKRYPKQHGCIEYEYDKETDHYHIDLVIDPEQKSFNHFLSTVIHECIHNYQFTYLNETPSHEKSFWKWRPKIRQYELDIYKEG